MKGNKTRPPKASDIQHWSSELHSAWQGIFIHYDPSEDNPIWTVILMFTDREVAAQVFNEIRNWNDGNDIDTRERIRVTVVQTEENEIHYFVYPAGKRPPYPVLSYSHEAVEGILPREFPPASDAEFLLQAFEVYKGKPQLISGIQPIRGRGLKYSRYSDLTSADLERFLLRFNAASVLAREPYRLPLPSETEDYARLQVLQREYFTILDEFFQRIVGKSASKVNSAEDAIALTRERLNGPACPAEDPYSWVRDRLLWFQVTFRDELARMPKDVGGVKLLLGGGRFSRAYSTAIQRTILYADTILIPDPLLPWLEEEREEERFQMIHFLQATYHLLRYKPLVDADLPYPALLVFPTWERTQLAPEGLLRDELDQFFVQFLSHYLGVTLEAKEELIEYIQKREQDFLKVVEARHLFVPPEGQAGMPIREAVSHYRQWIEQWRAGDYIEQSRRVSDGALVFTGIYERLSPQFMLMHSSDALAAQPLLAVPSQWHYYTLVTKAFSETLASQGLLNPGTIALLRTLETDKFHWLGNVPVSALVRLRMDDDTQQFRELMNEFISELHSSKLEDLNRVTAEVSKGIASLLAQHQKRLNSIEQKYRRSHILTLGTSIVTLAASFVPALAPFLGISAPAVLALKYGGDKIQERSERQEASRSLMGVLASATES